MKGVGEFRDRRRPAGTLRRGHANSVVTVHIRPVHTCKFVIANRKWDDHSGAGHKVPAVPGISSAIPNPRNEAPAPITKHQRNADWSG